jgi:serine/threonine protein kinase
MSRHIGTYSFNYGDILGHGSFSNVYEGKHIHTGEKVAVKAIQISRLRNIEKHLRREVEIMKSICHKNIVRFYNTYTEKSSGLKDVEYLYIVMEYCDGNDLSSVSKPVDEITWKRYFKQIVRAFQYLRSKNISHRDIKPENILLTKDGIIKIIDFTFARHAEQNDMMKTHCGTALYMAPELFTSNDYTIKSDIWSLGMLMYEYIYGINPFSHFKSTEELRRGLNSTSIKFPTIISFPSVNNKIIKILSGECLEIMQQMLQKKPSSRIDWTSLCSHPWLNLDMQVDTVFDNNMEDIQCHSISAPVSNHGLKLIPQKSINRFIKPSQPKQIFSGSPFSNTSLLIPLSVLKPDNIDNSDTQKSSELMFSFSPGDSSILKDRKNSIEINNKSVHLDADYFIEHNVSDLEQKNDDDDNNLQNFNNPNSLTKTLSRSIGMLRHFFSI